MNQLKACFKFKVKECISIALINSGIKDYKFKRLRLKKFITLSGCAAASLNEWNYLSKGRQEQTL